MSILGIEKWKLAHLICYAWKLKFGYYYIWSNILNLLKSNLIYSSAA